MSYRIENTLVRDSVSPFMSFIATKLSNSTISDENPKSVANCIPFLIANISVSITDGVAMCGNDPAAMTTLSSSLTMKPRQQLVKLWSKPASTFNLYIVAGGACQMKRELLAHRKAEF